MDSYFIKGFILGLSIAAPVGQIGVLCIRRTLADGRVAGFVSGLGAATADAIYGSIAAFGITAVSGFLVSQQVWLRALGGLFLLYLGARIFIEPPARPGRVVSPGGLLGAYASTFALTLTNPTTIISFAAVFAGLGLVGTAGNGAEAASLVGGVFAGSATWWFILSGGVNLLRERFGGPWLTWINRISGITIAGLGLLALASLL